MIARRTFLKTLGGGAVVYPMVGRAQNQAIPVVGILNQASPGGWADRMSAFRQGLSETGHVEGHNVAIENHQTVGNRTTALLADLVRRQVSVIVAGGIPNALAAKAATTAIPIVFQIGGDPVEIGLVASLNRPGGNLTGVSNRGVEVGPKRLELIHEVVPTATLVALLVNPTNSNAEIQTRDLKAAGRTRGLQLEVLQASTERDLDAAFATLSQRRVGALVVGNDGFFNARSKQIAALALRNGVATIYQYYEFAVAGGVMSYGSNITDSYRLMGLYAGRILKGEKPADLPVQQAAKVELIINMISAKALGLTIPISLLGRADQVIE